jgi:DNA-binding NtrC family response regulator
MHIENLRQVSLPHVHAMVIDDDAGARARTNQALRVMGLMHITELGSTGAPRSLPSMRSVDVVISELRLATGSGLALLKGMRLGRVPGIRPDLPFIFVTSVAYARMVSAAAHLDASGFVIKPVKTDRFREVLLRALGRRPAVSPEKYAAINVEQAMRISTDIGLSDQSLAPQSSPRTPAH